MSNLKISTLRYIFILILLLCYCMLGVEVQAEVMSMLESGKNSCQAVLMLISRYFVKRAKLQTDAGKFPSVPDYKEAVLQLDIKQ